VNRFAALVASIVCLAAAGYMPAGAQDMRAKPAVRVDGSCVYPDRLAPLLDQGHVFAECDRMEIRRADSRAELTFSFPARLREIELRGTFVQTGKFEAKAIRLRLQDKWEEAEGDCEFDPPGSDRPAVLCVVRSGPLFYVVNFTPET
jgi:hypothetical protein